MTFRAPSILTAPEHDLRRVRWQLAGVLVGLGVLAALIPTPMAVLRTLAGSHVVIDGDAATVAALTVASLLVWTLLGTASALGAAVLFARLPGAAGAIARVALTRLLPRRWHTWIGALAGIALLSGVAACGTGVAVAGPDMTTAAVSESAASPPPTSTAAGAPLSISGLDWPTGSASTGPEGSPEPTAQSMTPTTTTSGTRVTPEPPSAPAAPASDPATSSPTPQRSVPTPATTTSTPATAAGLTSPLPTTTPTTASAPGTGTPIDASPPPGTTTPPAPAPTTPPAASTVPAVPEVSPAPSTQTGTYPPAPLVVVVVPGDSLWRIAARHLPAGADTATIDGAWRHWYAANRSVIGADPNLILPGQHLHAPDPEVTR